MKFIVTLLVTLLLTVAGTGAALAETIYVRDWLVVTVREQPEDSAKILKTLKSDEGGELLEEGDTYSKVRTADGVEGYVKKQYLTKKRPKSAIIAELNQQIEAQKKKIATLNSALNKKDSTLDQETDELEESLSDLKKQIAEGAGQLKKAESERDGLQKELIALKEASGDVVSLVKARQSLQQENDRLTDELNTLREDNAYLLMTFYIKWFLAGAGVLFVGWMIGRSGRRKRRY